jgi:hypothetical protein
MRGGIEIMLDAGPLLSIGLPWETIECGSSNAYECSKMIEKIASHENVYFYTSIDVLDAAYSLMVSSIKRTEDLEKKEKEHLISEVSKRVSVAKYNGVLYLPISYYEGVLPEMEIGVIRPLESRKENKRSLLKYVPYKNEWIEIEKSVNPRFERQLPHCDKSDRLLLISGYYANTHALLSTDGRMAPDKLLKLYPIFDISCEIKEISILPELTQFERITLAREHLKKKRRR